MLNEGNEKSIGQGEMQIEAMKQIDTKKKGDIAICEIYIVAEFS
jgi:hypothetical protein